MTVQFPKLVSYQQEVYDWFGDPYKTGKTVILKSVRQSGKTFFCMAELILMALRHPDSISAIYEPTMSLARNVYKQINKALEDTKLLKISNSQLLEIQLTNGSQILFRSTEQTSRGLTVSGLLILDECAYLDDESIYTILPLVNANNAPIIIASTPFIQEGYYYDMFIKGLENCESIKSFDWSKHPDISLFLTDEKKELYKQMMSRSKYTTEVLGEFLADEGLLFTGLQKCIGDADKNNKIIYIGIDFATGSENDYTVITAVNNKGEVIGVWRTNKLTPTQQVEWISNTILDLASKYTIRTILGEINSIGSVYVDLLKTKLKPKNIKITEWVTSNSSKQTLVTTLQLALENGQIVIPNDPVLLNELKKYQATINNKTKTISYNGVQGTHDDCVISLMLAYHAYKKSLGNFSISFV